MDGRIDNEWTDRQMDGWIDNEWTDRQMDGWMDGQADRHMIEHPVLQKIIHYQPSVYKHPPV